ncbi:two component transcriptional regulator, LuxR family [Paenibacillus uliginis N3/975]|uniref:Two component transcriptional regulator, LuxR family n=1 Tax=Paenibacillus uliginis N3/975 TaxID=1313296 RepID=A0A1X7HSM6_9BACL|nr:response regulator transcription factor [Paenibacillus uliginis]SMF92049.1 two component transcriptional regulator, LuxR family [Paenibacillus uliginis N3/975]
MEQTITILIADDHALLRSGLKLLLQKKPANKVVGEASNGIEALRLYEELRPHILILDISMPHMDGIEVLKKIKACHAHAKVIVLTMHEDEDYITTIMKEGAVGYIPKVAVDEELYTAIDTVQSGYVYLRPQDTQTLIASVLHKAPQTVEDNSPFVILSDREREVLSYLVRGYTLVETAQQLLISIKTVDTHKTRMMNKLNLTKKSELVEYAIKYNLLSED